MKPKDQIEKWIQQIVPGKSFADIGGIGVDCINQRVTFAAAAGASRYVMADILPADAWQWEIFHGICSKAGITGVDEFGDIDVRQREDLNRIGPCDLVHCTGILYHVQSPADVLWNLRSITSKYLITNTVTYPGHIENEHGSLTLPDCGVLFTAAFSRQQRRILDTYYKSRFAWGLDEIAPDPADPKGASKWVEYGELTPWPTWWLYSDHAFRSLLKICRFNIIEEFKWEDHSLQVLCEIAQPDEDLAPRTFADPQKVARDAIELVKSVRQDVEYVSPTFHAGLWNKLNILESTALRVINDDSARASVTTYLRRNFAIALHETRLLAVDIAGRGETYREKSNALAKRIGQIEK